ncbi:Rad1/Rec1/Rad17 [Gongronella butleri]|nr:Rad1/Rec1/Rad17 [Gongronella butleri]
MVDMDQVSFNGTLKSVKLLMGLIKAVQFKPTATFDFHDEGITLMTTEHQNMKAVVFIKRLLFERYRRLPEDIPSFDIHLQTLQDCLGMIGPAMGTNDTCRLIYRGTGAPLEIMLEDKEAHLVINCKVTPLETEPDAMDFMINDQETAQRIIIKAQWLLDAFGDLDSECSKVVFAFNSTETNSASPCFMLYGDGANGVTSKTEFTLDSEAFIGFESTQAAQYSYQYTHINHCVKAVEQASEVSLRINTDGVLCILIRLKATDEANLEYTILPCHMN